MIMKNQKSKMEKVLDLLWKNEGTYIDVRNLTITTIQARKVFEEVNNFLKMMGITVKVQGNYRLCILPKEKSTLKGKNPTSVFVDEMV